MTERRSEKTPRKVDRRSFLRGGALGLAAATGSVPLPSAAARSAESTIPPFEHEEATIEDLQGRMESGELTATSLTEAYLTRIDALDRQGPELRSLIETNPEALEIAEKLDQERRAGKVRGPLHGIPILLKDNIDTADRMRTTAGSLALAGSRPPRDSWVAERLREAGAVLLGKANLSEWANFRSTRSSSGWSARGGQCRNPYVLDRNPCGSSSGSAAAVAANLCTVAIGTETNGSVVCPSSANGLVGVKPTVGLVSRAGIVPIAHSQDTAGPMARSATDAAHVLGVLTGVDPRDKVTEGSSGRFRKDYLHYFNPNGLSGARIGVARQFFGFHEKVDRIMEAALEVMRGAGAILVDPVELPERSEYGEATFEVLLYEFKHDIELYLASLGSDSEVESLADLIRFNEEHREQEMPFFEQEIFLQAEEKGSLEDEAYQEALARIHRLSRDEGIDKVMKENNLRAIVAPTGGPAWTIDLINGDHFGGGSSTTAAVAGYPNVTVPAGYVYGLPVGLSFFGGAYTEPHLLKLAYAFEQTTKLRRPPRFQAAIDPSSPAVETA